jgi:hypothetical protein
LDAERNNDISIQIVVGVFEDVFSENKNKQNKQYLFFHQQKNASSTEENKQIKSTLTKSNKCRFDQQKNT